MDETGFKLSASRRVRRVLPRSASIKSQSKLQDDIHITVVAVISAVDAPVPPYVIYPGTNLLDKWLNVRDPKPPLIATVTHSGYANTHTHLEWLERAFDPYTKGRAHGRRRMLFMDGAKIHLHVEFLEACWSRDIDVIVLPANLSSIFQPLDVKFFNILKSHYERQIDDLQLSVNMTRLPKGLFYRWFQRSWGYTANSALIRKAWKEAGLWKLSPSIMRVAEGTPERTIAITIPLTPENTRMIRRINSQAKEGEISYKTPLEKTEKSLEKVLAERDLMVVEMERRKEATKLVEAARGKGKRTKHTHGQLFDQQYQEEHAPELAARKAKEKEAADDCERKSHSKRKGKGRALGIAENAGPSNSVPEE